MRMIKKYVPSLMLIFTFAIVTMTTLVQTKVVKANDEVNLGDETELEIDKKTGIATPESVLENYLKKVEFIEGNTSFEENCYIYWESDVFKNIFLNDGNTTEEWENMTHLEKFNYHMIVDEPQKYNFVDEEDFVTKLSENAMRLLKYVEDGEVICNALEDVWRWQYQYYILYGTTYDFYNMDIQIDNSEKMEETIDIEEELSESDMNEVNQIKKEIENETSKEDNFIISFVKDYTLTSILVIAACVIGVIVYFKKNNKI